MTSISLLKGIRNHLGAATLCAAMATVAGCGGGDAGENPAGKGKGPDGKAAVQRDPVPIKLAAVRVEPVDLTVDLTGTFYGDESVIIAAKVPGRVAEWYHDFGDRVDEGTLLAQIDKTDYELAVSQHEASLREALSKLGLKEWPGDQFDPSQVATVQRAKVQADNAKAKLERARKLFEQKPPLISSQDFADIETAQQVAQHDYDVAILQANADLATARVRQNELAAARQRLADTSIKAPQRGATPRKGYYAVIKRSVSVGSYVGEKDPVFELVADDPIRFRAAVPERFMSSVRIGQTVRLTLENGGKADGKVSRINPNIDIASRTFELEATVSNPDHTLRPGAFVRASVIIGQEANATFVPKRAVATFAGINRVYSVKDGKAFEHRVELGEDRGDYVRVSPALKDVEAVALGPIARLGQGMPVSIEEEAPQTASTRELVEKK